MKIFGRQDNIRGKMLRGTMSLGTGQIISNAFSFLRNIIIARLLTPEDYGIAALFALSISFLEMLSNLSVETLMVQADYGNEEDFQGMVHYVQVLRGVAIAGILFLVGGKLAQLFSVPNAEWAFRAVSGVPFLRAWIHRDMNRVQREYKFFPVVLTENTASIISTFAAVPLCYFIGNYWAVVWVVLLQSFLMVAVSHLVSERRYKLNPKWDYGKHIFRWGWPLLINGILMFVIFQGDRFIIGSARKIFPGEGYPLEVLGWYSAAFAITLTPSIIIARVSQSLFLPALAESKFEVPRFIKRYRLACQGTSLVVGCFALPFVVGGGNIINLIYGEKYLSARSVISILAMMQAARLLRVVPTIGAMAKADTKNAPIANIFRVAAFSGVVICAFYGLSPFWIAVMGLAGEFLASIVSIMRLRIMHKVPIKTSMVPGCLILIILLFGYFLNAKLDYPNSVMLFFVSIALGYAAMASSFVISFPLLRENLLSVFDRRGVL